MHLRVDPAILLGAVTLSLAAAMLASLYPLRRLRRLSISDAIRQE
jgi:ABC-type antimicrobial peptide transport system permease subunit